MDKIILNLLRLVNQFKVLHWQTKSYARHKALDSAYKKISDLLDELVEVHQGKHGRIVYQTPLTLELFNIQDLNIENTLKEVTDYLSEEFENSLDPKKDTDCLNLRDEILATLNKLKYLLTLN